jgi:hypothetical protein
MPDMPQQNNDLADAIRQLKGVVNELPANISKVVARATRVSDPHKYAAPGGGSEDIAAFASQVYKTNRQVIESLDSLRESIDRSTKAEKESAGFTAQPKREGEGPTVAGDAVVSRGRWPEVFATKFAEAVGRLMKRQAATHPSSLGGGIMSFMGTAALGVATFAAMLGRGPMTQVGRTLGRFNPFAGMGRIIGEGAQFQYASFVVTRRRQEAAQRATQQEAARAARDQEKAAREQARVAKQQEAEKVQAEAQRHQIIAGYRRYQRSEALLGRRRRQESTAKGRYEELEKLGDPEHIRANIGDPEFLKKFGPYIDDPGLLVRHTGQAKAAYARAVKATHVAQGERRAAARAAPPGSAEMVQAARERAAGMGPKTPELTLDVPESTTPPPRRRRRPEAARQAHGQQAREYNANMEFKYEAMDNAGRETSGSVFAVNREDAQKQLRDKGLFVTKIGIDRNPPGLGNLVKGAVGSVVRGVAGLARRVVRRAAGGSVFKPKGTDTIPAMLSEGEYVVNAASTEANRGLLEEINAAHGPLRKHGFHVGGPVIRRQGGGVVYRQAGGPVGVAVGAGVTAGRLMVQFAENVTVATINLRKFADATHATSVQFAMFNAGIARANIDVMIGDFKRMTAQSIYVEDSFKKLAETTNKMRDSWFAFDTSVMNVQNRLATLAASFATGAAGPFGQFAADFDKMLKDAGTSLEEFTTSYGEYFAENATEIARVFVDATLAVGKFAENLAKFDIGAIFMQLLSMSPLGTMFPQKFGGGAASAGPGSGPAGLPAAMPRGTPVPVSPADLPDPIDVYDKMFSFERGTQRMNVGPAVGQPPPIPMPGP